MPAVLERADFDGLLEALQDKGYRVVGPALRDGAIVYDTIARASDLPEGWTDEQKAGSYRLKRRTDKALFGYAVGPHSWKKFLFPPALKLFLAKRQGREFSVVPSESGQDAPHYAFLGMRACELAALFIQDKIFVGGPAADPHYQKIREQVFLIAVQCSQAGGNCFCASMKTGPAAEGEFDLALTEIISNGSHYFVVETGSPKGQELLGSIPHRPASPADQAAARFVVEETAGQMGRQMDITDIREIIYRNQENPRWDEVGARCLTCANCTMVCPTCFCSTVEDITDLSGNNAERWRKWDSCFTMDFSYLAGGSVRASAKSRYRQWMTHKLASWIDQFGSSGCVGCGRCISWCPVGIDITEELRAIRASEQPSSKEADHGNSRT